VIAGDEGHGLREVTIGKGARPSAGASSASGFPAGVLLVLLYRDGQVVVPQGGTGDARGRRPRAADGGQDDWFVTYPANAATIWRT
jgi:hypothetical protein